MQRLEWPNGLPYQEQDNLTVEIFRAIEEEWWTVQLRRLKHGR